MTTGDPFGLGHRSDRASSELTDATGGEQLSEPEHPVRRTLPLWSRVLAAAMVLIVLAVGSLVFTGAVDSLCRTPFVRDRTHSCVSPDELTVITRLDHTRGDLEAVIAPLGGTIRVELNGLGIYHVRFPVRDPSELEPFMAALVKLGFKAFPVRHDPGSLNGSS